MNHDDISYALAKQLGSAYAIDSNYGSIDLDDEMRQALDAALRPILERRLGHANSAAQDREDAARDLLDSAHRFWSSEKSHGQHGAVKWISGDDGSLVIFTRGEYKNRLMSVISGPVDSDYSFIAATSAARDVLAERARQVGIEGWTPEHDDEHTGGEMAGAAACYAMFNVLHWGRHYAIQMLWPWAQSWWKPTDRRRNLVKAGALIVAEIERLDRQDARQEGRL